MPELPFPITPFDPKSAPAPALERLNDFLNLIRAEQMPDDPPIPLAERALEWRNPSAFFEHSMHLAWDAAQAAVIGVGDAEIWHTGDNAHMAFIKIFVHPRDRRQGIGRGLLSRIVDFSRQKERRLLFASTHARIPAGEQFMTRIGARRGLEDSINQLKISDLPAAWVETWLRAGSALSTQFEMGLWEGPVPEEHLAEMVSLLETLENDEPHDDLDWEDQKFSPEMYRETERNLFAAGNTRWMLTLRDRSTGRIAGVTEVAWNLNRPQIVEQGETGVLAAYRGRGLGRWLKASMAQKLLRDHPETRVIRTGNINSNAPMLKINREMGFTPYVEKTLWQVEREKVEAYLAG